MTDFGHELRFGAFLTPDAGDRDALLASAATAERAGLDWVTFQDHPYQPGFLDTWTLLSYLAARTERIGLAPNVANVPLRPPAVLARSAAALDLLSGGRLELGLGSGYFFDAIAAMGGPRRSPGAHVDALAEAITVLRRLWTPGPAVHFAGAHYRLDGVAPGPVPTRPIPIWVGAYQRRMLELTAREADAWVPTLAYAAPDRLAAMTATIDAAAADAGRDPGAVRRIYNIAGAFTGRGGGFLQGPPAQWAEQLAELTLAHGFSGFVLAPGTDADADLRRFAEEVAPATRELVARERAAAPSPRAAADRSGPRRHAAAGPVMEAETDTEADAEAVPGREGQQVLLGVHDQLRGELERLRGMLDEVAAGRSSAAAARTHLNEMTMRQNYWTLGAFCASYCRVVAVHHAIEDARLFPDLRAGDASLGDVLDRLAADHETIAAQLESVDGALVATVDDEARLDDARTAVDELARTLLAHLDDEEAALLEPIGRLGIQV